MELSYCTIPSLLLLGVAICAPVVWFLNREPSKPTPSAPKPPKEPQHKVNLAKPLRKFAKVGGGLTVAASVLFLVGLAYDNVTFVPCGQEDTISRAVKGTKIETALAAIPCPCGCGCDE